MATDLIDNVDYTLTRFAGKNNINYQITQYNKDNDRHEYVCLSEIQIDRILRKIQNCRIYGIVGNRTGFTYDQVKQKLDKFYIAPNDLLVSGGATGVDTHVQTYAKEIGGNLLTYYPNPKIESPKRFYDRNIKVARKIDELIAFNKKVYSGTTHTINRAKDLNKKVTIIGDI